MFDFIRRTWNAITGSVSLIGLAEEGIKLIASTSKSIPVIGPLLHHGADRLKDLSLQDDINCLKEGQSDCSKSLNTLKNHLSSTNDHISKLQSKLNTLSEENTAEKKQLLEELKASKLLKEHLEEKAKLQEKQISELNNRLNDFHQAQLILENTSLSHEQKLQEIQTLADKEKLRLNILETEIKQTNEKLSSQEQKINESFVRLDNLEIDVDALKKTSEQQQQEINFLKQELLNLKNKKEKSLDESLRKEQREVALSELNKLKEQEQSFLTKLLLLEQNEQFFKEVNYKNQAKKTFDITIVGEHWIDSNLLLNVEGFYPLEEEVYDFYCKKYGPSVMRRWIRVKKGYSDNPNSSLREEYEKNKLALKREINALQTQIKQKLSVLELNHSEETSVSPPTINIQEELDSLKGSLETKKKHTLSSSSSSFTFSWFLLLLMILALWLFFWWKIKHRTNSSSKKKNKSLDENKSLDKNKSLDESLRRDKVPVQKLGKTLHKKPSQHSTLFKRLSYYVVIILYVFLSITLFFFSFSLRKSLEKQDPKVREENNSLDESLRKQKEEKKLINEKKEEIIKETTIISNSSEEDFSLLIDYLIKNNYQFTEFLKPLKERKNISPSEYVDYIKSWRKANRETKNKKFPDKNLEVFYYSELRPFLNEEQLSSLEKLNLKSLFSQTNFLSFKVFLRRKKQEEDQFSIDKLKYPHITLLFSNQLLIDLNSLTFSKQIKQKLIFFGIIPRDEQFLYFSQ